MNLGRYATTIEGPFFPKKGTGMSNQKVLKYLVLILILLYLLDDQVEKKDIESATR